MAQFTRIAVAQKMYETGIVPVFYHGNSAVALEVLKACYNGGVRVFEFTHRADFAQEVFTELIKYANTHLPGMILGVGSVIDAPTAAMYLNIGANFIVSPIVDEATARVCNQRKVSWSPGCGTVTEINRAHELGAEVVKIFPGAAVGGPSFVKGVLGPMPWASIMPTGGVSPDPENLTEWFTAGVHCVGLGSQLFDKQLLEDKAYKGITEKAEKCIAFVKAFRTQK